MNKIIFITFLMCCSITMTSCGIYGKGETTGYIYAVDDGIFWDKVWYKSSLQSGGDGDCYLINQNNQLLKEKLRILEHETKVKLKYKRHMLTLSACGDGETDDEIYDFEIIVKED